mmetsp:Transcript_23671/g.51942  ORF Transcript_23671/g.51942 Transcript_23671/m.51942 type:complete len:87 (-) Transcript_23671:1837-2097(-)
MVCELTPRDCTGRCQAVSGLAPYFLDPLHTHKKISVSVAPPLGISPSLLVTQNSQASPLKHLPPSSCRSTEPPDGSGRQPAVTTAC